jgi:hypothetical protein
MGTNPERNWASGFLEPHGLNNRRAIGISWNASENKFQVTADAVARDADHLPSRADILGYRIGMP